MLSMTNFDYRHDRQLIRYFIDDPVHTLSNPIALQPAELFTANGTGILLELSQAL